MIAIPTTARIYILHEPISFHRQIDGLAAAVRALMAKDPSSGAYFLFRSRSQTSMRILHYDGSGYWLCTKRLSAGLFAKVWPQKNSVADFSALQLIHLQLLLGGRYAD